MKNLTCINWKCRNLAENFLSSRLVYFGAEAEGQRSEKSQEQNGLKEVADAVRALEQEKTGNREILVNLCMNVIVLLSKKPHFFSPELLTALSKMKSDLHIDGVNTVDALIKEGVAYNLNTPKAVVLKLALDSSERVRTAIAFRDDLPKNLIPKLASDLHEQVRAAVARRPDLPKEIISKLASDSFADVRIAAIENKNILRETLVQLTSDKNERVKKAAEDALKKYDELH